MLSRVDENAFKAAMRNLASGVAVITSVQNGQRGGMTATAVCSLSAQPPQLLVCVNRRASTHGLITESRKFCVNLLADRHAPVAAVFASEATWDQRFEAGRWISLSTGAPVLSDASAAFDCEVVERIDSATHSIFIGRVVDVWATPDAAPLVYFQSGFAALSPAN